MEFRSDGTKRVAPALIVAVSMLGPCRHARGDEQPTLATSGSSETQSAIATARQLYVDALALAKQGRFADAVIVFRRSQQLRPHPVTSYNLGFCERALGRYASAWISFSDVLDRLGAHDGAVFPPGYEAQAVEWRSEAEQAVARVTVRLTAPLTVRVDGLGVHARLDSRGQRIYVLDEERGDTEQPLPSSFELWLNPGAHVLTAADRSGTTITTRDFVARSAEASQIDLNAPPLVQSASPHVTAEPATRGVPQRRGIPAATWAAFGAGAGGFVASGVFLGLALHDKSVLDEHCHPADHCPVDMKDEHDRLLRDANLATVGLAVGIVGVGIGTYLWLTGKPPRADVSGSSAPSWEPIVTTNQIGVRGRL